MDRLLKCQTQREVKLLSHRVFDEIAVQFEPAALGGVPIAEWQRLAHSGFDGDYGDRGIYVIVNRNLSKGRLGRGRIMTRLKDHLRAFAINESLVLREIPPHWSMDYPLIELFRENRANGNRLFYVVLADDLTFEAARAGEGALLDRFKGRGFLINRFQ
jgi:hypothetical protein